MNYPLVFKLIGSMLNIEAAFMVFPLIVSLIYGGRDTQAFAISILITAVCGAALSTLKPANKKYRARDALAAASLAWVALSVFGAIPFYLSGCFASVIDALFESVSGFTTTGATILPDIERLPRGVLFWRSFSHWIGGMGILVFIMAVLPSMNASSVNLLNAESTGPSPGRLLPKIRETAKAMYGIYLSMTVLLIALLSLTGLPLYDALTHAFSVAGTGGFSNMNAGVAAYDNIAAEIIMTVFMLLFGVSFSLYFMLFTKNYKKVLQDEELRFYGLVVAIAVAIIAANTWAFFGSGSEALRHSSFQVASIISTTGLATTDYNLWPTLSCIVIVLLTLSGCCAGSTGGGIKLIRLLLLIKAVRKETNEMLHPRSVRLITVNGKKTDDDIITKVGMFLFIYFAFFFISLAFISLEGKDMVSSTTAVIAALSNVGPGLGLVGPVQNFSGFTALSKLVLSVCMIAGRLEFYPVLILFSSDIWRRKDA